MRPVDPRLLRYARATRAFLLASVALGLAAALLLVAQAVLLADIVVHRTTTPLPLLLATTLGRALISWLTELTAHRAGAAVKSELRLRLLTHATALDERPATGELTTLATRGIDALDDYFTRYLPQLALAVVVPLTLLTRIFVSDWISALTIAATLPLIPLFMVLIGWATQARTDRQWHLLSRLSGHFLDVVAGLPTLKVFGRAKAQAENIRAITADYRRATLRTLRIAFLSSFVLELLATISVALVAVGIGMRLVHGQLDLYTGLVVLILAPEAYLPLRQIGTHYHAAAEGLSAADQIFTILEREPHPHHPTPSPRHPTLTLDRVAGRHLPETGLTLRPGETVALVGPSGVGKSTLLRTVLGLEHPTSGRVLLNHQNLAKTSLPTWHSQIAWVPQHPHLFAGTIADNVRLYRPSATDNEVRSALHTVDLHTDPATPLGELGSGLSAGQRQRVALARALLTDRPVLLLDEPTAALDNETEATIIEALRSTTRTTLLATHRPALLSLADRVVHIGGPAEYGRGRGGAAGPEHSRVICGPRVFGSPQSPPEAARKSCRSGPAEPDRPRTDPAPTHLAPTHPLTRLRHTAHHLRPRFALALLLGTLAVGSAVALMATSGWLISRAAQQPPVLYLMVAVTATRTFGIGRAVFRYAERLVSHDTVLRLLADLRVGVYRRLERLAPAGLQETRRGDLLTRVVSDVEALQDYFLRWLLPAATAATVSAAAVGFTAALLPGAGAVLALGLATAGVAVPLLTAALSRRTERRLAPARGELATRTVDLLTGTAELRVAGALPSRLEAVRTADAVLTRIASRSATRTGLAAALTTLATGLTVTGAAWAGAQAAAAGRLDGVWLAVVVLTPLAAFEAVAGIPLAIQHRQRTRRSAERVHEVIDSPLPVQEPTEPAAPPSTNPAAAPTLTLHGLTARHPKRARPALVDLDLELAPGRRVAVVGPSGSGKTTLAQVLLRFLDPEHGTYRLNGIDATTLHSDELRRVVGLCAQDAHLFDSSLRENLRLARPAATDAELYAALTEARLDTWADTLPAGLDTSVGEYGARLSGGERQRLALARALLADFPVLVLDEPAEHLDLPTADALTADLLTVTEGRSTVLITHRLHGLEAVDEVIVLDEGRVVERGPYHRLAAADGPFRRLLDREESAESLLSAV